MPSPAAVIRAVKHIVHSDTEKVIIEVPRKVTADGFAAAVRWHLRHYYGMTAQINTEKRGETWLLYVKNVEFTKGK